MSKLLKIFIRIHFRFLFSQYLLLSILITIVFFILSLFYIKTTELMTSPVGWEKTFSLTPLRINARNIDIASKGNYIAAVYEAVEFKKNNIYVKISLDGGKNFFAPVVLATSSLKNVEAANMSPHIAISNESKLFVAWQDYDDTISSYRIYYSISDDMGVSWAKPQKIQFETDMDLIPRVYFDKRNMLHLFYHGLKKNQFNLYHVTVDLQKISFDNSKSLLELTDEMRGAFFPSIAIKDEYMFMVWQAKEFTRGTLSDDLFFMRSDNYGKSWSSPERITRSPSNDASPQLVVFNNDLYCVYQNNENKNWEIKLLKGIALGESWDQAPITVSDTNANCYNPSIISSGDNQLIFFWYDNREGKNRIFMQKYNVSDRIFSKTTPVSEKNKSAQKQIVIKAGKRILCIWKQKNTIIGKFSDTTVKTPIVFSRTHKVDRWSKSNTAIVEWKSPKDESGIVGYATIVNKFPYFNPTVQNLQSSVKKISIPFLEDGVSYFHIRAIDGAGNYSRTIHYRLNVSKNPLPFPIVNSPTHKEAKSSKSTSPIFNWEQSDLERVKGFLYSFSKDYPKVPKKFIKDKKINFDNLQEGRYYFSVRAVDKTNTPGRLISYEIIVGKAGKVDPSVYSIIAKNQQYVEPKAKKREKPFIRPKVVINLPIKKGIGWNKQDMKFFLKLDSKEKRVNYKIEGYSIDIGKKKIIPKKKINNYNDFYKLQNLTSGEYVISVKANYSYKYKSKTYTKWTRTFSDSFNVKIPEFISPLVYLEKKLIDRLVMQWQYIINIILLFSSSVIFIGFGKKFIFYLKLFRYKVFIKIKLLINKSF